MFSKDVIPSFIYSVSPTYTHWNHRRAGPGAPPVVSFPLTNVWTVFPPSALFSFRAFATFCFILLFCAKFCSSLYHLQDSTQFLTCLISIYWIVFVCWSERFYRVFTTFIARSDIFVIIFIDNYLKILFPENKVIQKLFWIYDLERLAKPSGIQSNKCLESKFEKSEKKSSLGYVY